MGSATRGHRAAMSPRRSERWEARGRPAPALPRTVSAMRATVQVADAAQLLPAVDAGELRRWNPSAARVEILIGCHATQGREQSCQRKPDERNDNQEHALSTPSYGYMDMSSQPDCEPDCTCVSCCPPGRRCVRELSGYKHPPRCRQSPIRIRRSDIGMNDRSSPSDDRLLQSGSWYGPASATGLASLKGEMGGCHSGAVS